MFQPPEQEQQSFVPTTSTDSKEMSTSSPDEGLGDSLAQRSSTSTAESKRSDSSDTDRNVDTLKSESDDNMEQKNIIITGVSKSKDDIHEEIERSIIIFLDTKSQLWEG